MRYLHDHSKVRYFKIESGDYGVRYDGTTVGEVRSITPTSWEYRLESEIQWSLGTYETRKGAADNLISANRPMAAWLRD